MGLVPIVMSSVFLVANTNEMIFLLRFIVFLEMLSIWTTFIFTNTRKHKTCKHYRTPCV